MTELLLVLVGLAVGSAVAWLFAQQRLARARADHDARTTRIAALETLEKELGKQLTDRQLEVADLRAALDRERTERARAEERWQSERRNLEEQRRFVDDARDRLGETFKALSADALNQTSAILFDRARETVDAQLGRREAAIEKLLEPLHDALRRAEAQVRDMEHARQHAYSTLEERVRALGEQSRMLERETHGLASALRGSQARGRWGEIALRRVIELAGMTEHCDFSEQVTAEGESGRVRPDMVVRMPAGRTIVLDSKVPLSAYLEAVEAATDEDRQQALLRHAASLRQHMQQLAGKAYWKQFKASPDLVVMFIPGEAFVAAAVEVDRELLADAMEKRVVVATPVTLFALLAAIAYGWQQQRMAKHAEDIQKLGQDLYERLATLGAHVSGVGTALGRAVEAYNDAVGSLERRLLPAARRFRDLGVGSRDEIPALETLDQDPRRLTAPEFSVQLEIGAGAGTAAPPSPEAPSREQGTDTAA